MNFTEEDTKIALKKNLDIDLIKKIIIIMNLIFEKDNIDIDSLFEYVLSNIIKFTVKKYFKNEILTVLMNQDSDQNEKLSVEKAIEEAHEQHHKNINKSDPNHDSDLIHWDK